MQARSSRPNQNRLTQAPPKTLGLFPFGTCDMICILCSNIGQATASAQSCRRVLRSYRSGVVLSQVVVICGIVARGKLQGAGIFLETYFGPQMAVGG